MLGFDSIGRLALGQLPSSNVVVLPALTGSFPVNGGLATFTIAESALAAAVYALNGASASFGTKEVAASGAFAAAGSAGIFRLAESATAGVYLVAGRPATFRFSVPLLGASFVETGRANRFVVSLGSLGTAFQVAGGETHYCRDFINWFPINPYAASWNDQTTPPTGWTLVTSQSNAWSVDATETLPPKVCE